MNKQQKEIMNCRILSLLCLTLMSFISLHGNPSFLAHGNEFSFSHQKTTQVKNNAINVRKSIVVNNLSVYRFLEHIRHVVNELLASTRPQSDAVGNDADNGAVNQTKVTSQREALTIISEILDEEIALLIGIVDALNQDPLYYLDFAYKFENLCNILDDVQEIRIRDIRHFQDKIQEFEAYVDTYAYKKLRKLFNHSSITVLNNIKKFLQHIKYGLPAWKEFLNFDTLDKVEDTLIYRSWDWVRKNPALSATVALLIAGGIFYFYVYPKVFDSENKKKLKIFETKKNEKAVLTNFIQNPGSIKNCTLNDTNFLDPMLSRVYKTLKKNHDNNEKFYVEALVQNLATNEDCPYVVNNNGERCTTEEEKQAFWQNFINNDIMKASEPKSFEESVQFVQTASRDRQIEQIQRNIAAAQDAIRTCDARQKSPLEDLHKADIEALLVDHKDLNVIVVENFNELQRDALNLTESAKAKINDFDKVDAKPLCFIVNSARERYGHWTAYKVEKGQQNKITITSADSLTSNGYNYKITDAISNIFSSSSHEVRVLQTERQSGVMCGTHTAFNALRMMTQSSVQDFKTFAPIATKIQARKIEGDGVKAIQDIKKYNQELERLKEEFKALGT